MFSAATKRDSCPTGTGENPSTTRVSCMANNAIADSIIMKIICRNLLPPHDPKICSTEVGSIPAVTLRILNKIKPVTKVFTAMDAAKPVKNNTFGQSLLLLMLEYTSKAVASQVARGDKLNKAYLTKIDH